ncbi:hypothetical protein KCP76_01250 [Salmonella enterica subsp. enterica serovar Weltevreden]|nr:hypothetical protein KCP76_01250 [Salmonella enterica subsp. enterica serovar Weltevreden]
MAATPLSRMVLCSLKSVEFRLYPSPNGSQSLCVTGFARLDAIQHLEGSVLLIGSTADKSAICRSIINAALHQRRQLQG